MFPLTEANLLRNRRWLTLFGLLLSLSLVAAACGGDDDDTAGSDSTTDSGEFSGELVGAGASSQAAAMEGWRAGYLGVQPGVTLAYDPIGSGGGREQFLGGGSDFAGSDGLMDDEEFAASQDRCASDRGAIHLPHYISPIAVAFNLDGIDSLNMSAETIAGIFTDQITNWSDEAIAADNPDVDLPDLTITPVHRSDESGTTENFTEYLSVVAPDVWTDGPIEVWPYGGVGADGTSGVVQNINAGKGTIGYADASKVLDLGTVAVGVGDEFVPFSPEAAAAVVEVSERLDGFSEFDYQIELARDTTEDGVYPIVLISYHIVCLDYEDQVTADLVKDFMTYVSSEEGQAAASAQAGSAPISDATRAEILTSIEAINAG